MDNAFYVFFTFIDMTLQKNVKNRVFWIFKKKRKKSILELCGHLCDSTDFLLYRTQITKYNKTGTRRTETKCFMRIKFPNLVTYYLPSRNFLVATEIDCSAPEQAILVDG